MAFGTILDWEAEVVSAALFVPSVPTESHIADLFEAAFGEKPTQVNESVQPMGRVGQALSQKNTKTAKVLALTPGRVDVSVQGIDSAFSPSSSPVTISDVTSGIDIVTQAAKNIAIVLPYINRVAVNCRLANHQRSIAEANKQILAVLPFKMPLLSEQDFIFQINNAGKIDGIASNRIIKWSVESLQLISATAPLGPFSFAPSQQFLNQFYSAFVHMDFNTIPSHIMLEPKQIPPTLDVLGSEIVRVRKNSLRFR